MEKISSRALGVVPWQRVADSRISDFCPELRHKNARHPFGVPASGHLKSIFNAGHMTHLAAGTGFRLAIEMKTCARLSQDLRPIQNRLADQIAHFDRRAMPGCRAEGPAGNCPDMLLEL